MPSNHILVFYVLIFIASASEPNLKLRYKAKKAGDRRKNPLTRKESAPPSLKRRPTETIGKGQAVCECLVVPTPSPTKYPIPFSFALLAISKAIVFFYSLQIHLPVAAAPQCQGAVRPMTAWCQSMGLCHLSQDLHKRYGSRRTIDEEGSINPVLQPCGIRKPTLSAVTSCLQRAIHLAACGEKKCLKPPHLENICKEEYYKEASVKREIIFLHSFY